MSGAAPAPVAWLLPAERMPVSAASAGDLRRERLAEWLRECGYEPVLLSVGDVRGPVGRGTARSLLDAGAMLASSPGLERRARREQPALVLTSTPLNAPALALVKRALGDRVLAVADVMGLHSLEVEQTTRLDVLQQLYRPLWRGLEALLFARADLILTVTDGHAALIAERHGRAGARTLRDAAEPELAAIRPRDRGSLGLAPGTVAMCFVGSLVCSRLDGLFEAWEQLSDERGASLVVVGDGPDLRAYRRRARRAARRTGRVIFTGALPRREALAVARACDIAFSDCWSRAGFPAKLFEYMALGMPILVQGRPQIAEVLTDGHDALFFSGPAELTARVRRLVHNPLLRVRLGRAARRTFLERHTVAARRREFAAALTASVRDLPKTGDILLEPLAGPPRGG